jgi:hypothetical protein
MVYFATPADELHATQLAAEELLGDLFAHNVEVTPHCLSRLEKLATACAKLAYTNNLASSLTPSVHNLIAWCDHLHEPPIKAAFVEALKSSPLPSLLAHGA